LGLLDIYQPPSCGGLLPLSFAHVAVLAPKTNFDSVYADVAP